MSSVQTSQAVCRGAGSRAEESGSQPTLKLTPPTPVEPANGHRYEKGERPEALEVEAATGEFAEITGIVHRLQVFKGNRRVVDRVASGGGGTARLSLRSTGLSPRTEYRWRVRGENEDGAGPWSATSTFTTRAGLQPANRPADPPPGQRLPFPGWGAGVVQQVAAAGQILDRDASPRRPHGAGAHAGEGRAVE